MARRAGRVRLVGHGPLRHPPGVPGAHRGDVPDAWTSTPARVPRSFPTRGNVGPGVDPDHPRLAGRHAAAPATGCCSWASARGSTPAAPRSSGDGGSAPTGSAPAGLPGLDPSWSRLVSRRRRRRTRWHVLDAGRRRRAGTARHAALRPRQPDVVLPVAPLRRRPPRPAGGSSPSTSSAWGSPSGPALAAALAERVADLDAVLGRARRRRPGRRRGARLGRADLARLGGAHTGTGCRGIVLANTGGAPAGTPPPPALIRLARTPALRHAVCAATPAFVRAAAALSRPPLPREVRDALAAPYGSAERRRAVEDFVADIPLEADHPSAAALDAIAEGVRKLDDVPVLLLWGPRDPVFADRYLRDLRARLPHADVHRYEGASHLVLEDARRRPRDASAWIAETRGAPVRTGRDERRSSHGPGTAPTGARRCGPGWEARAGDPSPAVVEPGGRDDLLGPARPPRPRARGRPGRPRRRPRRPRRAARAARRRPHRRGARRAGGPAPSSSSPTPGSARRASPGRCAAPHPAHVDRRRARAGAAAALGVPGSRIAGRRRCRRACVGARVAGRRSPRSPGAAGRCSDGGAPLPAGGRARRRGRGAVHLRRHRPGQGRRLPPPPARAQLAALRDAYGITADDRLVAAFAPFALYGPALGIASAVPADVDRPARSPRPRWPTRSPPSARRWCSPRPPRCATSSRPPRTCRAAPARGPRRGPPAPLRGRAGAGRAAARPARRSCPRAAAHTPYGMTEALPVTDIALDGIDAAGPGNGVCVGRPLPGVDVAVSPLSRRRRRGRPAHPRTRRHRRDQRRARRTSRTATTSSGRSERASARDAGLAPHRRRRAPRRRRAGCGWRAGWSHVITTADGPVTPVGIEQRVQALAGVDAAAAVGVGPAGTQQVVVVVVPDAGATARRRAARCSPTRSPDGGGAAPRPACRSRRCWSPTPCPSTSGTRRRSTAPRVAAWAGAGAGRRRAAAAGRVTVRVLVTGATRHARRRPSPARWLARGDAVTVLQRGPSGLPFPEVRGDLGDPAAPLRRALAGHDAVVHLAAKVDVVGPWRDYRAHQRRRHPRAARRRPVRRGRAVRARVVAVGGARRGRARRRPGRRRPTRPAPAGTTPAARPLAEQVALAADDRRSPSSPSARTSSGAPATRSSSAGSSRAPARAGCPWSARGRR